MTNAAREHQKRPYPGKRYARRKLAKQSRSRETVSKILAGTWHILGTKGARAVTTRAVAEESGVNIASIYQFFPNKQAILHELYVQRLDTVMAVFDRLERPENMALGLPAWLNLCSASFDQLGWSEPAQVELLQACTIDRELRRVAHAHIARVERRVAGILQRFLPNADPSLIRLLARFVYGIDRVETEMLATEAVQSRAVIRQWKQDIFRLLIQKVGGVDISSSDGSDAAARHRPAADPEV